MSVSELARAEAEAEPLPVNPTAPKGPWEEAILLATTGYSIPSRLIAKCHEEGHDINELAAIAARHSR